MVGATDDIVDTCIIEIRELYEQMERNFPLASLVLGIERLVAEKKC